MVFKYKRNKSKVIKKCSIEGYTYINSINKYIASIKINGTSIYLGHYNTELGAKLARERAENKYFKNIKYNEKTNS